MAQDRFQKDIQITGRAFDLQTSDRAYVDLVTDARGDISLVEGRNNLVQAVINRLLTRKGELATLGHPQYGSRLYLLVGEPNNIRVRGLADAYIREALGREPRVQEITFISFDAPARGIERSTLRATIGVRPVGNEAPFTITLPINLEG